MRAIQSMIYGTAYVTETQPIIQTVGDAGPGWSMVAGSAYWASPASWYLSVPNDGDWALGTGDFTIEWWQWTNTADGTNRVWTVGADTNASIGYSFESGGTAFVWMSGATGIYAVALSNWEKTWNHMALVRYAGVLTLYQNGLNVANEANSTAISDTTTPLNIGQDSATGSTGFDGHIADFHWIKGYAKYRDVFSPPTAPITAIPGALSGTHPAAKNNSNQAWLDLSVYPDGIYIPVGATVTSSAFEGTETVTAVNTTVSPGYVRLTLTGSRTYHTDDTYEFSWTTQTRLLLNTVDNAGLLTDSSAGAKTVTKNGDIVWNQRGPYMAPVLWLDSTSVESYTGSGTVWNDVGKTGSNATLAGSYSFSNGVITFEAAGQGKATGPSLPNSLPKFTAAGWIKLNSEIALGTAPCLITETYVNTTINYTIGATTESGTIDGGFWDGSGWRTAGASLLSTDTWYHLVITYNGSQLKWYVDGSLIDTQNWVGTPASSGAGYRIAHRWDLSQYVDGAIPVAQVFDRALSAGEVSTVYNYHSFV